MEYNPVFGCILLKVMKNIIFIQKIYRIYDNMHKRIERNYKSNQREC